MSIVKERAEELKSTKKIDFNSISMEEQIKLFLDNKELYLKESLNSKYEEVRRMPRQFVSAYSSSTINRILNDLAMEDVVIWLNTDKYKFIIKVLNNKGFEIKEETMELLANSDYWRLRYAIAKRQGTSFKNLKSIFFRAVKDFLNCNDARILDAVILNSNFKMTNSFEKEIRRVYSEESAEKIFTKVNRLLTQN